MNSLFVEIIKTVIAFLGAYVLLSAFLLDLAWPSGWCGMSEEIRAIIIAVLSMVSGIVFTLIYYYRKKNKQHLYDILSDIEVKLTQLEGVLNTVIILASHEEVTERTKGIIDVMVTKYGPKYFDDIESKMREDMEVENCLGETFSKFQKISIDMANIVRNWTLTGDIINLRAFADLSMENIIRGLTEEASDSRFAENDSLPLILCRVTELKHEVMRRKNATKR